MNILIIPNPVVLENPTAEQLEKVRAAAGDSARIAIARNREEELIHAPDAEVVLGFISRDAFVLARRLRWVQTLAAGVDAQLFPELVESDVLLTSEKGMVGTHLSEHAFALMLGLTRGVVRAARHDGWIEDRVGFRRSLRELAGATMGIVGLGGTGVEVARRAAAFGMRVVAVDPEDIEQPPFVDELWKTDRFPDLLSLSDVVTICCPLTRETKGLFDESAFRRMKRSAILVNVTRGPIVDEQALVQALQEGLIAGAGLDVTPREPLPADSPLWRMENVIITSHTAGASQFRADRVVDRFCENLRRLQRNETLLGLIDKVKGY